MANDSDATDYSPSDKFLKTITALLVSDLITFVVGVVINVWLLASILTSTNLRIRLRNQLICSITVLHLVEELTISVSNIHGMVSFLRDWANLPIRSCHYYHFYWIMTYICSIVPDILIVELAGVFLAQVLDFDPASKLRPKHIRAGKAFLVALPWTLAVVISPLLLIGTSFRHSGCYYTNWSQIYIIEAGCTILPLCVAAVMISIAVGLRYRRFGRGRITAQGNMGVQLVGSGPEIDSSHTYIGAMLVCAACQICQLIFWFHVKDWIFLGLVFHVIALVTDGLRCVLLPLVFLFLTDIRQHIKAWRPWRPWGPPCTSVDLTLAYNKEP